MINRGGDQGQGDGRRRQRSVVGAFRCVAHRLPYHRACAGGQHIGGEAAGEQLLLQGREPFPQSPLVRGIRVGVVLSHVGRPHFQRRYDGGSALAVRFDSDGARPCQLDHTTASIEEH